MRVSETQLQRFVERYLDKLKQLTSTVLEEKRQEIFPDYFVTPYDIIGIISSVHGVAIEFIVRAKERSIKVFEMDRRIENAILPQQSNRKAAVNIVGENCSIVGISIFTKEFYDRYVKTPGEGTAVVLHPPLDVFVHVQVGCDVVFDHGQFGAIINGSTSLREVEGFLWIFGSNSAEDFTLGEAESRALSSFRRYLGFAGLGIPKSLPQEQVIVKLRTLTKGIHEFQGLIRKKKLKEQELQAFFERNPAFLCLATYRRLFPQVILEKTDGGKLIPDFLLERVTDNYCDVLDIKLPRNQILAGVRERRRFTAPVYDGIAQVRDYREYFEDAQHRKEVEKRYGLSVYKPNMMVLIGSNKSIRREELLKVRAQYTDIQIVTFDDLINLVMYLKTLLENSLA